MADDKWTRCGSLREFNTLSERLLVTVGDRRRMRVDLLRAGADPDDADDNIAEGELSALRDRLSLGSQPECVNRELHFVSGVPVSSLRKRRAPSKDRILDFGTLREN
jgi:hypothetical protein